MTITLCPEHTWVSAGRLGPEYVPSTCFVRAKYVPQLLKVLLLKMASLNNSTWQYLPIRVWHILQTKGLALTNNCTHRFSRQPMYTYLYKIDYVFDITYGPQEAVYRQFVYIVFGSVGRCQNVDVDTIIRCWHHYTMSECRNCKVCKETLKLRLPFEQSSVFDHL